MLGFRTMDATETLYLLALPVPIFRALKRWGPVGVVCKRILESGEPIPDGIWSAGLLAGAQEQVQLEIILDETTAKGLRNRLSDYPLQMILAFLKRNRRLPIPLVRAFPAEINDVEPTEVDQTDEIDDQDFFMDAGLGI